MRDGIRPGAEFPDLGCRTTDSLRRLSELQGADPMVLTLHRGMFYPTDRMQLLQLVPFPAECVVGYTRLVSISSDDDLVPSTSSGRASVRTGRSSTTPSG